MFFRGLVVSLFAAFVLIAPTSAAALSFTPAAGSPITQDAPDDVVTNFATGDFNEDGNADTASVGDSNRIFIELGQTDGTFTAATGSPFGTSSSTTSRSMVEAADLNGDNHLDLLVNGRKFPVEFETFLGSGDGTFSASPDFTVTLPYAMPGFRSYVEYSSPSIGDLNNDGKLDFAMGMYGHSFNVAIGSGDGSFTAQADPVYVPTPNSGELDAMVSTAIGDFNGDGDPDVAMAMQELVGGGSGIYVADGDGDGTFTPDAGNPVLNAEPFKFINSVQTINLNGDAYDDVSLTQPQNDPTQVRTMLGGEDGLVANPGQGAVNPGDYPFAQAIADVNADGNQDIVPGLFGGHSAAVILGDGTGGTSLAPGSPFPFPQIDGNDFFVQNVAIADFNGDGALDIAGSSSHSGQASQARGIDVLLATATASVNPEVIDFPDTLPNQASTVVPVTLTNGGVPDLHIASGDFGGNDPTQFAVGGPSDCPGSIAGGDSCTFSFKFTPSAKGKYSATAELTFTNGVDPITIALSGATPSGAAIDPVEGSFGEVISGYAPDAKTLAFTITSSGGRDLALGNAAISGFDKDDFELVDPGACSNSIPSGQTCSINVRFKPAAGSGGLREAKIEFPGSNVPSPIEIPLGGYARKSEYTVTPASHDFGEARIGSGSTVPQTFTVTSTGAGLVPFNGASLSGPNSDSFSITANDCPAMIGFRESCQIKAAFDPESGTAGPRSATLAIDAFSSVSPGAASIALAGTATVEPSPPGSPKLMLKLTSAKTVKRGKTLVLKATVTNTGDAVATSIQLKTIAPGKFVKKPNTVKVSSLAAGQSITRSLKVKVKKSAKRGKKLAVKVTASGNGVSAQPAKRTVKIK